ncbi:hypothetical protein [Ulvibacter litoralis]|uniref:DUF3037 domain-containing protein n=1 Tax=Ulvibacter litoralis TaxID=227084 RepID=A0A1G7IK14_9FLAO|nr:hypothetical protein [Ulvibacter litoralis]GHC61078.1 hypothetical protein GCM10008083_27720 [Ulvibacter litoralis]SDF12983.1 hypothetical protein SAMN05421855_10649 [Ulvibacter litoralis]
MKTFFSIIYLPLGSDFQEKISIGMVMSNGADSLIRFSNPKLSAVKNIISSDKYSILKNYLKNLADETIENNKLGQFNLNLNSSNNWINEEYFSYLNRYSNNLVMFSEPRNVDMNIDINNFKSLFEKFVFYFEDETAQKNLDSIYSQVKRRLYSKIEDNVNLNVTVRSSDFRELITPVDVNFIGKNGIVVAGQTIDFVKRHYNLEHDLTSFVSFSKAVDYSRNDKGKYFLVGEEPSKKEHPKNHRTWKQVIESHLVEYVDLSETEIIQDYIRSKSVTPFFDKISDSE